ncbi:MAG: hypothetical protein HY744_07765 [Deltaproteobacteria bacterium]|nr:hypothetical protein [Deltaproteobacteria bacterium]
MSRDDIPHSLFSVPHSTFPWKGKCTSQGGSCVAASDDDCRTKSERSCKKYGRCTARAGACIAATDADCKDAELCRTFQQCTAREGDCVK